MKKSIVFSLCCVFFLFACEREQDLTQNAPPPPAPAAAPIDTVFPRSYYPIYPGSYWQYTVTTPNGTSVEFDSASASYGIDFYVDTPNFLVPVTYFSDSMYVPKLNGNAVYGYSKIDHVDNPFGDFYIPWPILSETVGDTFERAWTDKRFGDYSEKLIVLSKTQIGPDSVITLKGHWVYGPNINNISIQEYVKNIGLTKHLVIDTVANDTVYKRVLTSYLVND
ncbi:MAG: hypothetical protein ACRCYO_08885 [Bacteroidia bacterium]